MGESFEEHRPHLFGIAYRMTGSAADAEDLVQEAFLRWSRAEEVRAPKEYLSTTVTRLSIDHLRSARVRREEYVGPWLPEPLAGAAPDDPLAALIQAESVQTAFLVVLESLGPTERAAFLLREVFGYEYAEVAAILDRNEASCRQLVHRARERVSRGRPRFESSPEQLRELTERFARACAAGDLDGLLALLTDDAVAISDGGGKALAALRPVQGASNVARLFLGLVGKLPAEVDWRIGQVSGQPGMLMYLAGRPYAVLTLAVAGGRIGAVYVVNNPDKLSRVEAP